MLISISVGLGTVGTTLALLAASGHEIRWLAVPFLLSGVFYKWIQWAVLSIFLLQHDRK
jgi:hypothetical protein